MFKRRNSGSSTKEREQRGSPLRFAEPIAAHWCSRGQLLDYRQTKYSTQDGGQQGTWWDIIVLDGINGTCDGCRVICRIGTDFTYLDGIGIWLVGPCTVLAFGKAQIWWYLTIATRVRDDDAWQIWTFFSVFYKLTIYHFNAEHSAIYLLQYRCYFEVKITRVYHSDMAGSQSISANLLFWVTLCYHECTASFWTWLSAPAWLLSRDQATSLNIDRGLNN